MSNRRIIKILIFLLIMVVSNIFIFKYANLETGNLKLNYEILSDKSDIFQVFYSDGSAWAEENSQKVEYVDIGKEQRLEFDIPIDTVGLRLDLGNQASSIIISEIKLSYYGKKVEFDYNKLLDNDNLTQIDRITYEADKLQIATSGTDPFIVYEINDGVIADLLSNKNAINYALKIVLCIVLDILLYLVTRKSRSVLILVQDLYNSRSLIWSLAKNDFKTKYAGSYLGIIWAFIQPVVTILLYWFVFEFGLKAVSPNEGVPFILWFSIGLIPWFFFSDSINNAMNCLIEYSYLVKKVVFKISILPIVKIISSIFVHFVFVAFIVILASVYGFYPTIYFLQLPYYIFCTFFLVLGISYATSAIVLFFKDLGQIISILLQIGMWATPIMWSYTILSEKLQWIIKLNPMYYIIEGYRDIFINHIWFFQKYFQTIYFFIVSIAVFLLGALVFKKLKPHFADVL